MEDEMNNCKIIAGTIGSNSVWKVVDSEGNVMAHLHGPSSAIIALAATENINNGFEYDGWSRRLRDSMK